MGLEKNNGQVPTRVGFLLFIDISYDFYQYD
jgi:hypothetical protein